MLAFACVRADVQMCGRVDVWTCGCACRTTTQPKTKDEIKSGDDHMGGKSQSFSSLPAPVSGRQQEEDARILSSYVVRQVIARVADIESLHQGTGYVNPQNMIIPTPIAEVRNGAPTSCFNVEEKSLVS